MKRGIFLVLVAALFFSQSAYAAPKKIAVKPMQLVTTVGSPDEVSGVVASGKSLIVFGTQSLKAYVRAVDTTGKELWKLSLDQSPASIATAAAVDSVGNIWIAGSTPLAMGLVEPTPTATPLNPDNAVVPPDTSIGDLRVLSIWKVSAAGTLISTSTLPTSFVLFPTAISVDKNGASIVGVLATQKGKAGFFINLDQSGTFSKLLQLGTTSTTLESVVRHSDGGFTVVGSSAETLLGKKVAGVIDGVLVKISSTLKISSVVRSSLTKGKRIWNSASSSLLLSGEVVQESKKEVAVTKFNSSFVPTWTYRFPSMGRSVVVASSNIYFLSTGPIPQLNWNPKTPTPLLLTFDSKGGIIGADSGPAGQKEVMSAFQSKDLGLLVVSSSAELVSIFTLIPR